jgi:hypothetical protein
VYELSDGNLDEAGIEFYLDTNVCRVCDLMCKYVYVCINMCM